MDSTLLQALPLRFLPPPTPFIMYYDGEYENGVYHGAGQFAEEDGSLYCGSWSKGLRCEVAFLQYIIVTFGQVWPRQPGQQQRAQRVHTLPLRYQPVVGIVLMWSTGTRELSWTIFITAPASVPGSMVLSTTAPGLWALLMELDCAILHLISPSNANHHPILNII